MAAYRLRIGASGPPDPYPEWRTAMVDTDKVYAIGDLPSVAEALIDWPAAGAENQLYAGTDSNYVYMHYGYGGSVYVPEIGTHGAMVFGTTGEAIFSEQLTSFTLSADMPTWTMFQQPLYATSEAEAITMEASWYYNQATYDALVISDPDRIVARGAGESDFAATWDAAFPVGYANWIIREKVGESCLGNSRWHSFRYNMPRYIPPSMTGTSNGAIVVTNRGPIHGPFSQGQYPDGVAIADWFSDVWGTGRRKYYLFAMDVVTKVWQRLATPVPDFTGFNTASLPVSCVDESTSRIYYLAGNSTNFATFHADFSAGLSGMTMSGPTNLTDSAGGPAVSEGTSSVFTQNHPTGKRLWYVKEENATPSLLCIDLAANTMRRLSITGLPSNSAWWSMGYDSANNRIFITTKAASGVSYYKFIVPTDPTDAANYVITSATCTFDTGVTLESGSEGSWQYGDRGQYLPTLGVILMTQRYGKMLAYRPA